MSSTSINSADYAKAVSSLGSIDWRAYVDWTTSPLGKVVKERLSGKVAIVTGASSGIGAVTARRLAAEGAKVVLFARREDKLAAIVNAIKKSGGAAAYFVGDAAKEEDNKAVVDFAVKTFGGLNIAFNNAGIATEWGKHAWEISASGFEQQNRVNIDGVFFGIKYQLPAIGKSGGGVVVTNASVVASHTFAPQLSIYSASKSWVVTYSRQVSLDAAKIGVRVNSISPGLTFSDIQGGNESGLKAQLAAAQSKSAIGRPVKPEEIAAAVAYLASDDAEGVTGSDLVIDAGFNALESFVPAATPSGGH